MTTKTTARWITRLRAACPRGWSVAESRGKIRLTVRSGAGGSIFKASTTLPFAWAADEVGDAITLINDLHSSVESGHDLRDALARVANPQAAAKPSSAAIWPELVKAFKKDLKTVAQIQPATWERNYRPFLDRVLELMAASNAPSNARDLMAAVISPWADRARSRNMATDAVRRFLEFAVEVHHLPAETWTLTERAAKQLRGARPKRRTVATFEDAEILHLISSLNDSEAASRWGNALKLMALYGLRPEELNHLTVRQHPETGEPALFCTYCKKSARGSTEPRWLMPLPLQDRAGETVQWNLAGLKAIGQLPLPPLSDKYAIRTFLERQQAWLDLKSKYDASGEWARPYSFRNSYSLRGHRAGHQVSTMAHAMGHGLNVHQSSYEWAKDQTVLAHI